MTLKFPGNPSVDRPLTERAFTLIELMVVLILLAILTAVILPDMRGTYEDALLRATSRRLVDAFHLAYSQAIISDLDHRVRLDLQAGHYYVERTKRHDGFANRFVLLGQVPGADGNLAPRIRVRVRKPGNGEAEASAERQEWVPQSSGSPVSTDSIVFHGDGTAEAAEVVLRDRDGFQLTLHVNPVTAHVRVLEEDRP